MCQTQLMSRTQTQTKLDSLGKQVRELSTLLKEQQVNALNQANTRTNDVNKKIQTECHTLLSLLQTKRHTLQYCRTKAFDDERKRQYNRENQQKKPTYTNDYNKRKGPNFGSQNYHNSNSQHNSNSSQRYGNSYSLVSCTIETKISAIRIITIRVTLIKGRISELDKTTTTFPQDRITTPILSITEISLRTNLMPSLTMCNSLMTTLKR